jgi:hypothetical protein
MLCSSPYSPLSRELQVFTHAADTNNSFCTWGYSKQLSLEKCAWIKRLDLLSPGRAYGCLNCTYQVQLNFCQHEPCHTMQGHTLIADQFLWISRKLLVHIERASTFEQQQDAIWPRSEAALWETLQNRNNPESFAATPLGHKCCMSACDTLSS